MFPRTFFPGRFFAAVFFPQSEGGAVDTGGPVTATAGVEASVSGTAGVEVGGEVVSVLYIGCDNTVFYRGAQDKDGNYLNDGTGTYVVKDGSDAAVAGGSGSLAYVAASNGNYEDVLDRTVTALLTPDAMYYVEITFAEGEDDDFRRIPYRAVYRGAT